MLFLSTTMKFNGVNINKLTKIGWQNHYATYLLEDLITRFIYNHFISEHNKGENSTSRISLGFICPQPA